MMPESQLIGIWAETILETGKKLQTLRLVNGQIDLKPAVTAWQEDKQHGAKHSADVYTGALQLCRMEGVRLDDSVDTRLQWLAVVHDLAQFLPGISWRIKIPRHAMIGAMLIFQLGESMSLARDLAYHDLTLVEPDAKKRNRQIERLSPVGKIFHDADKLYGLGFSEDPIQLAANIIIRNRIGAFKEEGWYLIRDDLSDIDRRRQKYGMRWFSDRLASVGKEIVGMECLTVSGRSVAKKRSQALMDTVFEREYGNEFDQTKSAIKWWVDNHQAGLKLELVGKNFFPQEYHPEEIQTVVRVAVNSSLRITGGEKYTTQPRGVMMRLSYNGEMKLIDPSIARFKTKAGFLAAVKQAISVWEKQ